MTEIEKELNYSSKYGKLFIVLVCLIALPVAIALPLGCYIKDLLLEIIIEFLPFVLLGVVIYVFPFCTPEAEKKMGLKKA